MVDPYDFIGSPTGKKSKQTRKKTIIKTSKKKRKSNEKSRRVSIRQTNNTVHIRTRSNTRDTNQLDDVNDKENNSNNGFTQLIQTKMMEVKKQQQHKRTNKQTNVIADENQSPSISRKRQRIDNEDTTDAIPNPTEINHQDNDLPKDTNDEHVSVGATTTTTCHPRCESKDHFLLPANKRRRACLCSKRQLDELEFATDSFISPQTQRQQEVEQQQPQDELHFQPNLTSINSSPPPLLLLPSSSLMPPPTSTIPFAPVQSVSIIQQEEISEEEEEQEQENQLNAVSVTFAPLSPAMPLNSTYIAARRSIPIITQMPQSLLAISTLPLNTTTISDNITIQSTSSIVQISNLEPRISNNSSILPPIESISNRQDQETSMTPAVSQTTRYSISTQTDDDYYPTHHHCNDVSVCPCVQIYTRSEQLFMASMAIFFRNSIHVTPPESSLRTFSNTIKKNTKRQSLSHQSISPQSTPIINEIEIPIQIEAHIDNNNNIAINETYVINNNDDTISAVELEPRPSSTTLLDTSTVINETRYDNTKKSDGSSIQINIDSRQELNEKHSSPPKSSNDQNKFKSLVLAMTALKDHQKIEFNRFLEYFSVRSSTTIDDTTTHLITDEEDENSLICPLTGKVLQAITRHLKIVSYRWLTVCLSKKHYIDEIPTYEIIGDTIYNQHYGMSRSRMNISNNFRLLANYAFHLKCHGCQPFLDNRPLIELIHSSGGLVLKTLNQHIDNIGRQIIILCSKTYLQNKPALQQACEKLNIFCIEPEWLIASIVKFDIQPYEPWLCTLYS
ncbi:unnamed protein product [Adineta steineri]|uniref:BRCT domain-containing protein n=1 Tax=Adineta steineri TaxID=433720 RepID=A0A813VCF4_9BILA|nr:unnamed protein product [Adineta steineri]